jgi:hypothetical protein
LDMLRQEVQKTKVQLRDLEMGNDDLERNERLISSSLADIEAKYSRALEEKILLEHELLDKAGLEEECQRLKDELRGERRGAVAVIAGVLSIISRRKRGGCNPQGAGLHRGVSSLHDLSAAVLFVHPIFWFCEAVVWEAQHTLL